MNISETAKFCHPIEKGNHYVTTTLEDDGKGKRTSMCKEYTAPRNWEDSRPYASIDAEQEIGPVLNIGIATVFDVPGIEVKVVMFKTKVEPSSVHRETVASTIRVAPVSSKSSSGSGNPTSIHTRAKSIYIKKEIPKEDRIWTFIPGIPEMQKGFIHLRLASPSA